MFERAAVIGIGLIGSSLCHACKRGKLVGSLIGAEQNSRHRAEAESMRLADKVCASAKQAVDGADLVILATPVGHYAEIAKEISSSLKPGAILTDVGSVKASVVQDLAPHLPEGVHLVPGHPIAGTELSGPGAGFASLFDNRWCIITPAEGTDPSATQKLKAFWEAIGSRVETMSPEHHDLVLAITSHLPHLIAFNIVNTASHLEQVTDSEVIKFSAGGFRDFTRIAASDPTMWRDVFLNNREAVLDMLGRFTEDLTALQRAIRFEDGDMLHDLFSRARKTRRDIIEAGQDISAPDFGRSSQTEAKPQET